MGEHTLHCAFKDTVCHTCQKKGHIAKKCRGAKDKQKEVWRKTKPRMNTHDLHEQKREEQCSFNMFNLTDLSKPWAEPTYATLQVNGKELEMEVDTGASASVISQATYHRLCCSGGAPVLKEYYKTETVYG